MSLELCDVKYIKGKLRYRDAKKILANTFWDYKSFMYLIIHVVSFIGGLYHLYNYHQLIWFIKIAL